MAQLTPSPAKGVEVCAASPASVTPKVLRNTDDEVHSIVDITLCLDENRLAGARARARPQGACRS